MSSTILSTKVLSRRQKDMVLNANIRYVEYDAIKIAPLPFELDSQEYDALIFTSQNSVKIFFEGKMNIGIPPLAFCVGEKTKELVENKGLKVEFALNAQLLAEIILKKFSDRSFLFLTGKQRLDVLPNLLTKNNIRYNEIHIYETLATPKQFGRYFEGVLFFSPSAVESHLQENDVHDSIAFCIGQTTEKAVKNYAQKTVLANKPSIENVLIQAIKELRPND